VLRLLIVKLFDMLDAYCLFRFVVLAGHGREQNNVGSVTDRRQGS
jgi:hypothetical protein